VREIENGKLKIENARHGFKDGERDWKWKIEN
jgi:hypothetical protein